MKMPNVSVTFILRRSILFHFRPFEFIQHCRKVLLQSHFVCDQVQQNFFLRDTSGDQLKFQVWFDNIVESQCTWVPVLCILAEAIVLYWWFALSWPRIVWFFGWRIWSLSRDKSLLCWSRFFEWLFEDEFHSNKF